MASTESAQPTSRRHGFAPGVLILRAGTADRALPAAWVLCVASAALWFAVHFAVHPHMLDLSVYRAEGFALRHGAALYGPIGAPYNLHATYPPFAVLCFAVLTLVPAGLCFVLAGLANLALLAAAVELARRLAGQQAASPLTVPLVTAIAIWCEPVFATLHFGQINLLIMVLVLWDFSRAPDARGRGVALGLAIALKVTPAIFVVYLLLIRRFRSAATAIGAFACFAVVSIAVRPHDTVRYWTSLVFDTRRVGNLANPANQSLRGVLVRAAHQLDLGFTAAAVIAVAAVLGLACSVRAYRQRGEAWGLCAAAVTGLLVSPVSWSHHWVWCVPIAVLFVTASPAASWRTRGILGVACLVFVSYHVSAMVPSHQLRNLHMSPVAQLDAVPYVLFGVLFLALAASARPLTVRPAARRNRA